MSDNQKFIAGLLLGAVAGAALALFLTSEKGEELVADVKEGVANAEEDLKAKLHEFDTAVNQLLQKGKSFIEDLEQKSSQSAS